LRHEAYVHVSPARVESRHFYRLKFRPS
jgi:hypothetical protein